MRMIRAIQTIAPKIMTGELAPARHVLGAATRSREPGSDQPRDATGSGVHPGRSSLGDTHILTVMSIWKED